MSLPEQSKQSMHKFITIPGGPRIIQIEDLQKKYDEKDISPESLRDVTRRHYTRLREHPRRIPRGTLETYPPHLIAHYAENPLTYPGHDYREEKLLGRYTHPYRPDEMIVPRKKRGATLGERQEEKLQASLIDTYYTAKAPQYSDMYYKTDEEALERAIKERKQREFLPYRNVSLGADAIVTDWEEPLIRYQLDQGKSVLCLGSGTGDTIRFFSFIPHKKFQGYDIAYGMVAKATELYGKDGYRFTQADTQEIAIPQGEYGIIISNFGPPSYWRDLQKEGKKFYEALPDDGMVCLGLYSHQVMQGLQYEESTTKEELKNGIDIHFYTTGEAIAIMHNAGFPYVVARGVNFDSTRHAWEQYQKKGELLSAEYWKKDILERDALARSLGKQEHWARHLYVFASKAPFVLTEDGHVVYTS